ncbi:MAG TPA: helix-turn-helix domain-containing protein [Phycisphaerae bacterium]|nr:helix-turn-helix domain-containing protein [Phycisphaerae bacterium]
MADDLMTADAAAAYLGLRAGTLAVWRCTGRYNLPFIRVGRKAIRYSRADLDRFLAQGKVGAATA